MNKTIHSEDFIWYDKSVKSAIEALDAQYPNAIPVFGGALSAVKYVHGNNIDMHKFCILMLDAISNAKFYNWHENSSDVAKRFCHFCYIDPALVEIFLGVKF